MKEEFQNQLTTAILSCPIVYIPHFHYKYIDEVLEEILCPEEGHKLFNMSLSDQVIEYDCGRKRVVNFLTKKDHDDIPHYDDVVQLLKDVVTKNGFPKPVILLLKNFSSFLNDREIQSLLASFAYQHEKGEIDKTSTIKKTFLTMTASHEKGEIDKTSTIVIVSPIDVTSLPKEIEKYITVVEMKAPNQEEIMGILKDYSISNRCFNKEKKEEILMDLCRTLQGLQLYEIKQILDSSLIRTGMKISAKTKQLALEEKKKIVRKSGIIEVVDANEEFNQIGGLEILKEDLRRKAFIYKHLSEAQENKVTLPKGILILGMPGCGKTMIAKSIANEFGVSLLRLDVNRLMGKYVGESETNLRNALATAEAAHPCVLWIDEIEKAFAGTSGHNSDMLVMRLMGHFLTWMQERTTPVFIVATANDVMRPEFMRKGRFDEVYFVDFPNEMERTDILRKTIEQYQKENSIFDFSKIKDYSIIVDKMEGKLGGFSGAEIKNVVNMVIEKKFGEYLDKKALNQDTAKAIKIDISEKDFSEAIDIVKDSVMANQVSKIDPNTNYRDKTNIERIKEMQDRYNFKRATKNN